MRTSSVLFTAFGLLTIAALTSRADDYLTKDGKLTEKLKIVQLQGGFAGFTGMEYTIEPDGTWTAASVFKQKATPKSNGKLTAKELESLAAVLKKYDLAKMPESSGKAPGANPKKLNVVFGKQTANWIGQQEPKLDADNPAGSVESRFAGISQEIAALLKSATKKADAEK
jgi:hypothetical protein